MQRTSKARLVDRLQVRNAKEEHLSLDERTKSRSEMAERQTGEVVGGGREKIVWPMLKEFGFRGNGWLRRRKYQCAVGEAEDSEGTDGK